MSRWNSTYYYNGEEFPAFIQPEKGRLGIQFQNGESSVMVYWYYHDIKKNEGAVDTFSYTAYPPQTLKVLSKEVAQELQEHIRRSKKGAASRKMGPLAKALVGFILLLLIAYFFLLPWIAAGLANRFPVSQEKAIGEQLYQTIEGSYEVDEQKTALVNTFFRELRFSSQYQVQITVVKGNEANAFAIPGGRIVVYDKLVNSMGSYEELAAMLSHEFIHVEHRHSLRNLFRQFSSGLFLALIVGDAGSVSSVLLSNADELKNLSYSRSLETEADESGAKLLAERGIDCNGFVRLFQILKSESKGIAASEWMSSHPDLENRIKNIRNNTACAKSHPQKSAALHSLFLQIKTAE